MMNPQTRRQQAELSSEQQLPLTDETTGLLPNKRRASLEVFLSDGQDEAFQISDDETKRSQQQQPPPHFRSALALGLFLVCGISVRLLANQQAVAAAPKGAVSSNGSLLSSTPHYYWNDETHDQWQAFLAEDGGTSLSMTASLLGSGAAVATSSSSSSSSSSSLLYFNQTAAFGMVDANSDFFHYQNGWEAQITQALCAIATTAALLNSFRDVGPNFVLPMDPIYVPFPWATQNDLLGSAATDDCVLDALGGTIFNALSVYHMGLGLTMVPRLANCFLRSNGYSAKGHPALGSDKAKMKAMVVKALQDPSQRVIYNYDRGGIGQGPLGHGHWSPLGGYHAETDSFLVMDVAKYKHPMVWVSWDDLWGGAVTLDNCGETLALDFVDWTLGFAANKDYLKSRCIPGSRGFVVVKPLDGEL